MCVQKRYPLFKKNKVKAVGIIAGLLLFHAPVYASPTVALSVFSNPLAITLLVIMGVLVLVIALLANVLTGIADVHWQKQKEDKNKKNKNPLPGALSVLAALLFATPSLAQEAPVAAPAAGSPGNIAGLSETAFYIFIAIIFVEILVIFMMLINIKFLLKKDTDTGYHFATETKTSSFSQWWSRFNKFKPIAEEKSLELDHEYDGIRELDNRLPPWWLYGFYLTIIFAVVYLWRYHVAYSAPLSKQEYEISVKNADEKVKNYLAKKGETIDENTVTVLTDAADLEAGKQIFKTSCMACHKENGAGMVGPNLTDDYWLHGGTIKNMFKVIKYGYNAMPQWQTSYSNKQIAQVASYVKSLHGTHPPDAKPAEGTLFKEGQDEVADSTAQK